jgi:hypothetical protein
MTHVAKLAGGADRGHRPASDHCSDSLRHPGIAAGQAIDDGLPDHGHVELDLPRPSAAEHVDLGRQPVEHQRGDCRLAGWGANRRDLQRSHAGNNILASDGDR